MNPLPEQIVHSLLEGDNHAYEEVFKTSYNPLFNLANGILKNEVAAEEQVQEVFIKLWEKRSALKKDVKLFAYLVTSVRNRCYNYIRDQGVAQKYVNHELQQYRNQIWKDEQDGYDEEVINRMYEAIENMPDKCREVFKLSRFEGMSHKEISEKLSISTKTIENHITKAMKLLKSSLTAIQGFLLNILILLGDF